MSRADLELDTEATLEDAAERRRLERNARARERRAAAKAKSSSSSTTRKGKRQGSWGGRREGAGAKPLTPEKRLAAAITRQAQASDLVRENVERLLEVTDLSPRRRLLHFLATGEGQDPGVRSDGEWLAAVIERTCVQTIGRWKGLPLKLEPWQRRFLVDALTFDEAGEYLYGTALLGIPRKNGKTTTTSGVAVVKASPCDGEGKPEVLLAAGSKEQAGPLFATATDFVNGSELLRGVLLGSKSSIECPANGGSIETLAGDGKLNHGRNPYFTAADELHAWMTPRQRENWNALTTADGARDDALFWIITTAGFDKRTVLGELYDQAYTSPHRVDVEAMGDGGFVVLDPDARLCVHWYAIGPRTAIDDLPAWKRANPASWRTVERIRRDLAKRTIDEPTKRRLYGNVWTSSRHVWIPDATVRALVDDDAVAAAIAPGSLVGVAVDASLTRDTTAVTIAAPTDDGRIAVRVRVFSTRPDVPAHVYFAGETIDLETVERYIAGQSLGYDPDAPWLEVERDLAGDVVGVDLSELYTVAIVGYDPRYFNRSAERLEKAGTTTARYEPQARETFEAVQAFYNLVTAAKPGVAIEADDVLLAHIAAAAGERRENGWKVSKLRATSPIDGLVSAIIGVDLAIDGLELDDDVEVWADTWDDE